jgi:hypothetical protein
MNSFLIFPPSMWESRLAKPLPILWLIFLGIILGISCLINSWAGLVLALAFNALFVALSRPILLCYLVIAGITLTSGMGRGQLIPGLIPNEVILVLSVVLALPLILARRSKITRPPAALLFGIVILVGGTAILPILAYYFRGISLSLAEVFKLVASVQYILLAGLFFYIPDSDDERYQLVRWMWLCSGIVAAVGLLQAAGIQSVISFLQKWYPSNHSLVSGEVQRVTSLMSVWNGLGTFLMVNMLLLRSFRHLLKSRLDRILAVGVFLLCITCLLASGSYAGLIGLVIGFGMISLLDGKGWQEIKVLLLGLVIGIVPLQSMILNRYKYQYREGGMLPQTLAYRIFVWRDIFWPVLQKNWLWGYRPKLTDLAWQYPESIYFAYLLSSGIFALFAHFVWLFVTLAWLWRKIRSRDEMVRTLAIFLVSLLVVLSIMGITNEVFTFSGTVDYLWILLGLVAGKEGLIHVNKQHDCHRVG